MQSLEKHFITLNQMHFCFVKISGKSNIRDFDTLFVRIERTVVLCQCHFEGVESEKIL